MSEQPTGKGGFEQVNLQQDIQEDLRDHTVPVILTGLGSATFFCAVFILCANQRDRYLRRKWDREMRHTDELADDNSSEKSVMMDNDFEEMIQEGGTDRSSTDSGGNSDGVERGSMPSWVHSMMREMAHYGPSKYTPPASILPPIVQEGDEQRDDVDLGDLRRGQGESGVNPEDLSISRVSTLTTSIVDGSSYFYGNDVERQAREMTDGKLDTDTADDSRGLIDPSIRAAMKKLRRASSNEEEVSASVCSSLTDGTNATNHSSDSTLLGEDCMLSVGEQRDKEKVAPKAESQENNPSKISIFKSVQSEMETREELSADDPADVLDTHSTRSMTESSFSQSERRGDDISLTGEMKKLEKLISSIRPGGDDQDLRSSREADPSPMDDALVKDVFFSPQKAYVQGDIGLTVEDAQAESSNPMVTGVDASSPFFGEISTGDMILRVNDVEVAGMSGDEVLNLVAKAEVDVVKVTVISTVPRKPKHPIDYGTISGREEV